MKKKEINDNIKELVVAFDKKIEEHKKKLLGDKFEKDGSLFKTKVTFNAKSMTKYQYSKLFALYDFMQEHPKVSNVEIRRMLRYRSINYSFLNKCDISIEDFLDELRYHGPVSMALIIEEAHRNKGFSL